MREFEKILLRLKEQLGVQTDREIAELLGMSVKAFTARKMRDSFPEDKLHALKARRPDLDFDTTYVLTGQYLSVYEVEERLHDRQAQRAAQEQAAAFEQDYQADLRRELREMGVIDDQMLARAERVKAAYIRLDGDGKLAIEAMLRALEGTKGIQK